VLLVDELEELVPFRDRVGSLGGAEEFFRIARCLETRVARMIKIKTHKQVETTAAGGIVSGQFSAEALQELPTHLVGIFRHSVLGHLF
jgi:hypothetical protein